MSMVRPIALNTTAFDATQEHTFYFTSSGGNQVVGNHLTIVDNRTQQIVYDRTIESFDFSHSVPPNTMVNGQSYYFYFSTYDVDGDTSIDSNSVSFYCYTTPTLTFTNIVNNKITSANYQFDIQYNQIEGEKLDFAIVYLYTALGELVSQSENIYTLTNNLIQHTISGFSNHSTYKIKARGVTVNGTIIESALETFTVVYSHPTMFALMELENKCREGYIQIGTNIKIIDGISYPDPPIYEAKSDGNDAKIVLNSYPYFVQWEKNFEVPSDFVFETWCNFARFDRCIELYHYTEVERHPLDIEKVIDTEAYIKLVRDIPVGGTEIQDCLQLDIYVNNTLKVSIRSNYVDMMNGRTDCYIWLKKVGNDYEFILTPLSRTTYINEYNNKATNNVLYNMINDTGWNGDITAPTSTFTEHIESIPNLSFNMIKIRNGIFDGMNITQDTTKEYSEDNVLPNWDYDTIINCDFNRNISGGNLRVKLSELDYIRVKRREQGKFEWLTISNVKINKVEDLNISVVDSYLPTGLKYEYALVPAMKGKVEGDYIIDEITSKFMFCYLSDIDTVFTMYSGVVYGNNSRNIKIGKYEPIGTEYPITLQNAKTNYKTGTISVNLLGNDFLQDSILDRNKTVAQIDMLTSYLTNGKAKIFRDWNGNILMIRVSGNPTINYDSAFGNSIASVQFPYVEIGKYDNQLDLYNNGFVLNPNIEYDEPIWDINY